MHVLAGEREPELEHLHRICPRSGVAVDVGANIGFYTFKMARRYRHVFAFEPNSGISSPIRSSGLGNVTLIDLGLSNREASAELHIPVIGDVALSGWASLEPDNCPGAEHHLVRRIDLAPLDGFGLEDVALVKIDVEGHELEVLQGARATIEGSRPVLIVEIKKDRFARVSALLASYDYVRVPLEEIAAATGGAENHVFRHRSQAGTVRAG